MEEYWYKGLGLLHDMSCQPEFHLSDISWSINHDKYSEVMELKNQAGDFNETWKEIETDIDFSKYEPISTSNSFHIYEERYEIDDKKYRLLYVIGYDADPSIEVLM